MEFKSFWVQSVILVLYFILIFVNARIFDIILWLMYGTSSMHNIDPIILNIHQLKQLLDLRGVSYSGYIEKGELVQLVKDSANVVKGEIEDLHSGAEDHNIMQNTSNFKGTADFFKQVKDSKDSIWLVQVIPVNYENSSPINGSIWKTAFNYLTQFSIRTGIYNCAVDHRFCSSNGWNKPLFLLSFPKRMGVKDKVVSGSFHSSKPEFIIQWIRKQITSHIQNVKTIQELENEWLSVSSSVFSQSSETIKVLLLTHLLNPPLFLAALSIKFTGRIKFGVFSIKVEDSKLLQKKLKMNSHFNIPVYLIISHNQTIIYGKQKPQYINFKSMNTFLKVLQPEMNDIFIISLVLINMLTCLKIFQIMQEIRLETWFWDIGHIIWTIVSLNILLLALWVVLAGNMQWPIVSLLSSLSTKLLQTAVLTETGSLLIADCLLLYEFPILFLSSFLLYSFVLSKVIKHISPTNGNQTDVHTEEQNWWEDMLSFFLNSLFRSRTLSEIDDEIEEHIDNILSRRHIPNFWLQPAIPNDYIKDLPIWMFNGIQIEKEMETIKNLMDNDLNLNSVASCSNNDNVATSINGISNDCTNQMDCKLIKGSGGIGRGSLKFCSECLKSKQSDNCVTNIVISSDCAICLDVYETGCWLCALPCGHTFHKDCIQTWLERDNHHCPICRWPAYKYMK